VADGFVGNVALKYIEGHGQVIAIEMKKNI